MKASIFLRILAVVIAVMLAGCATTTMQSKLHELHQAIEEENIDKVRSLIDKGADVNLAADNERDVRTPLIAATFSKNTDIAKLLIEKGANVDLADKAGRTPLMFASANGATETAKLLIKKGAKVDSASDAGYTPLMFACAKGQTEAAKLLLNKGAKVERTNNVGWTPLMLASMNGATETTKFLIKHGADPSKKDRQGYTAFDLSPEQQARRAQKGQQQMAQAAQEARQQQAQAASGGFVDNLARGYANRQFDNVIGQASSSGDLKGQLYAQGVQAVKDKGNDDADSYQKQGQAAYPQQQTQVGNRGLAGSSGNNNVSPVEKRVAPNPSHAQKNGITDLAYSMKSGNNLYFTGKYKSKPVHLVHNGATGSGKWTIYTGTLSDRVRLTIDDKNGVQEALSMDKGQLITLNQVGQERIEYRFYAPNRSFIIGSVLYRKNNRWLHGMMKTEAFAGYPALTSVSDVTKDIPVQAAIPSAKLAEWLNERWQSFNLISTAYANTDDLIRGFFSDPARNAREFFGPADHEMFKGALVGLAAFSVKLASQTVVTGEAVAVSTAVATATPFLAAVGAGVAIGLAADKVRNWGDSKHLDGTNSATDLFNRLVEPTEYTKNSVPEAPPALDNAQISATIASEHQSNSYMRPSEVRKLEDEERAKQGKDDFRKELDMINSCTSKRDFACADDHIVKASKLQSSYTELELLNAARRRMSKEKERKVGEAKLNRTSTKNSSNSACSNVDTMLVGKWGGQDGPPIVTIAPCKITTPRETLTYVITDKYYIKYHNETTGQDGRWNYGISGAVLTLTDDNHGVTQLFFKGK